MKHNLKITIILLSMFLITQIIGLWVVNFYNISENQLPYGMQPPEKISNEQGVGFLQNILIVFVFAIILFFVLTKIKAEKFIRAWFFVVTIIAIALCLNVIFSYIGISYYPSGIAILLATPLAFYKVYKRNLLVHNTTELLIYPGIAAVFVPILGVLGIIILLLAISLYDIWAVWKSEFMKNLAKFQIDKVKVFSGFFVPYANKKTKQKIKLLKDKSLKYSDKKRDKFLETAFKKAKIKINLAILGGGDIIFPIITAGIFYKVLGLIPALIITASATLGLLFLFMLARKGKFYPAMPFLTIAMYLGMMISWLI